MPYNIILRFIFSILILVYSLQSCGVSAPEIQAENEDLISSASDMQQLADLLTQYSDKVVQLEPNEDWGDPQVLVNKMKNVSEKIASDEYDIENFFSDFNGKSPQGEMWEVLDSKYPELKAIGSEIRKLVEKLDTE